MKSDTSTRSTSERRAVSVQTHHIHYDPVSGYIHKFRLDGSQDVEPRDNPAVDSRHENLPLIVGTVIAVGLLIAIGTLTL
jgi:hypothetical protein